MKTKKVVLTFFSGLLLANSLFAADTFLVDPVHSNVGFAARHLLISKVEGIFREFSGTIQFDEKDAAQCAVTGTIKVGSIDTINTKRDVDLKSPDWFDVEKYPEISFQSKKVEKKVDAYLVTGVLTIRGVSKDVAFPATVNGPVKDPWGKIRIGVEAKLTLNRRDFNMLYSNRLDTGGLVVSNEIEITINAEAIKK